MTVINVFVLDEHPMIRLGVAALLNETPDMRVVGEGGLGADALRLLANTGAHLVLMGQTLPDIDSVKVVESLRQLSPPPRVLLLTATHQPDVLKRAIEAGAQGALLKTGTAEQLLQGIRQACSGRRVLPHETAALANGGAVPNGSAGMGGDLTQRERQLLELMAQGLSNQHIASQLCIAKPTVKFHVTNILSKLHADNRTEAVLTALRHKLVVLT